MPQSNTKWVCEISTSRIMRLPPPEEMQNWDRRTKCWQQQVGRIEQIE